MSTAHREVGLLCNDELDASITVAEIRVVLSKMKNNKAPDGLDRIPGEFYKHAYQKSL